MTLIALINLASLKAKLSLKAEAASSYLNYLWWVIEPALEFAVFYLVFTYFFASTSDEFAVFLLSGLVGWSWFSKSITNVSQSILNGSWLLDHIKISPVFFPLVIFFQDSIKSVVVIAIYTIVMGLLGIAKVTPLMLLATIFLMGFFIFSFGFFLATLLPVVPDLKHIIPTGIMIAMFCSGVFFNPEELLAEDELALFFLNPIASGLALFRYSLADLGMPSVINVAALTAWSAMFLLAGLFVSDRLRDSYAIMVKR